MALPVPLPAGQPIPYEEGPPLVERLIVAWLLSVHGNTRDAYRRDIERWIGFCTRHQLDPLMVKRAHADAYAEQLRRDKEAPATVNRRLAAAQGFYRYCLEDAEDNDTPLPLRTNPFRRVKRAKISRSHSTTRALTCGEALKLLAVASTDTHHTRPASRSFAIVSVLLVVGLRATELCTATIGDLGHSDGHQILTVTRKGGGRQKLVMPPVAWAALGGYEIQRGIAGQTEHGWQLLSEAPRTAPLIASATGRHLNRHAVWTLVHRLAQQAGIGDVHPHVLRKTAGTAAHLEGATIQDIQAMLGHADPQTTLRYIAEIDALDRSPAYAIGKRFTLPSTEETPWPLPRQCSTPAIRP